MYTTNPIQEWIAQLDRRVYAALIGLAIGLIGGLIGLLLAVAGPVVTFGAVLGALAGLYILTDISAALYGVIVVIALIPFGTLPFKIAITPTLLDLVMGAFLIVYLFQWMSGHRQQLQLTPVHALVALYLLWFIISFVLGLRYAPPTAAKLRQFAETLLSIGLVFILVDLLRDPAALRRLVLVVMLAVGVQALVAIILYALPDDLAERTLIRLARIGYPDGGVIRYIEDDRALAERAIGTWVDPNLLGGMLAISASMIAPQIFAQKPVIRFRWLTALVIGVVTVALILTFSRASMLAFAAGVFVIAAFRHRRFIPVMVMAGLVLFLLPQTQSYIERFGQAFTGSDLATQMRLGEYGDAMRLISRYGILGVGFTGTPDIDLYTDVASMYLIMANQIGIIGLSTFLVAMIGVFVYGLHAWRSVRSNPDLDSIHLGYHAALLTVLLNSAADMYFFRIDFQSSVALFWLVVALALASSRLALTEKSTVAKSAPVR